MPFRGVWVLNKKMAIFSFLIWVAFLSPILTKPPRTNHHYACSQQLAVALLSFGV